MSAALGITRVRLQRLLDERVTVSKMHEDLLAQAEKRDEPELTDVEKEQIGGYRKRQEDLDGEIRELNDVLKREEQSADVSREVRAQLSGSGPGVTTENGETKYRSFAVYARDEIITKFPKVAMQAGGDSVKQAARERLMRAPAHTLSEDIAGLLPPQHLTQIMDVIDRSRPIIASARRVSLERGQLTYPDITQRPTVEVQSTEKTEGGTAEMQVAMRTANAVTYIGGGNLSWQAINWSSPDALELWFDLAAESYAIRTEAYAAGVLIAAGTASGTVSAPVAGTSSFPQWMTAIGDGMNEVYDDSGAMADTLYLSPDLFFALAVKTSSESASFISEGGLSLSGRGGNLAGLRVVVSKGLGTATAILGDSSAFFVAEAPGAPVELRAVEPAIGGLEVGLIGALAAVAFDAQRFVTIG